MGHNQNQKLYRERKEIHNWLGEGKITDGYRASFWIAKNVLELDRGEHCHTLYMY